MFERFLIFIWDVSDSFTTSFRAVYLLFTQKSILCKKEVGKILKTDSKTVRIASFRCSQSLFPTMYHFVPSGNNPISIDSTFNAL